MESERLVLLSDLSSYNQILVFSLVFIYGIFFDLVWISVVMKPLYLNELGNMVELNWLPGFLFYCLYSFAIYYFVLCHLPSGSSYFLLVKKSALLGLVAYGSYALTMLAVFSFYPLYLALLEMAWGIAMTTVIATLVVATIGRVSQMFG